MNTLKNINEAFSNRLEPLNIIGSNQLSEDEYDDVMFFKNNHWSELTCTQLEAHYEGIYWLSPEAFCYFLPRIISAGIRENKPDLMIYNSIIEMLDRSPDPSSWDRFFIDRWTMLSSIECEAVQEWVLWLADNVSNTYYENSFNRAFESLELLKQGVTSIG